MKIKYPLLIPVIGHGATDIIDNPKETIFLNIILGIIIKNINEDNRKLILILSSIFHLAKDIPNMLIKRYNNFSYVISCFIHFLWIQHPLIAKINLLLIHTPLHYYKIYKNKKRYKLKLLVGGITSLLSIYFLKENLDIYLDNKIGKFWWLSPILSHIIITEFY